MKQRRRILFLTGTRADFGKLKGLMQRVEESPEFDNYIFATGMHMLSRYGSTIHEIEKCGFTKLYTYINQTTLSSSEMDLVLSNTIQGLGHYVRELRPDLIVVHGDRIETLAGAIVGSLNNIHVAHIEGGEVSGTVDELIRHAVTKLSHFHFVSNEKAKNRLSQLGEQADSIFVIGSPDVDIMLSKNLPSIEEVLKRYQIPFENFGIFIYHPVTTEQRLLPERIKTVVSDLVSSQWNFVVIYPNNDTGSDIICRVIQTLANDSHFRILPSMRFEHFLTLLKKTKVIVGNSSTGIREAPIYGVPSVNIGNRQNGRFKYHSIINVIETKGQIISALEQLPRMITPTLHYGVGESANAFMETIRNKSFWLRSCQKQFCDVTFPNIDGIYPKASDQ